MTGDPDASDVRCESCGASIAVAGTQRTARCPFCDAPSVAARPPVPERPQPVFALGFAIERDAAVQVVGRWIRRRRMAPFRLKRSAPERLTGVYLPSYLYSATARAQFQASIAEKYREFGIRKDSDGRVSLGNRDETEYRDLTGRHVTYVADILVTASGSVTNQEMEAIEPFDLGKLRRYSPPLVAGWSWEEPSRSRDDCLRLARAEADASVAGALHRFMPGDGVGALRYTVELADESLDPTLVPVWVCAIRYDARKAPVRILVNGQTGKAGGVVPFSWAKLGMLLALGGVFLVLLAALASALGFIARLGG